MAFAHRDGSITTLLVCGQIARGQLNHPLTRPFSCSPRSLFRRRHRAEVTYRPVMLTTSESRVHGPNGREKGPSRMLQGRISTWVGATTSLRARGKLGHRCIWAPVGDSHGSSCDVMRTGTRFTIASSLVPPVRVPRRQ